jgi:hypothetical protein
VEESMKEETGRKPIEDLPYSFDLFFDIKTKDQLILEIERMMGDVASMFDLINVHNILLTKKERKGFNFLLDELSATIKQGE